MQTLGELSQNVKERIKHRAVVNSEVGRMDIDWHIAIPEASE
jgi:hypothetical protein